MLSDSAKPCQQVSRFDALLQGVDGQHQEMRVATCAGSQFSGQFGRKRLSPRSQQIQGILQAQASEWLGIEGKCRHTPGDDDQGYTA